MKSVTVVRSSLNKLKGPSDQNISINLRIEGDLLVKDGKLFEALEFYNKSLCAAQLNSQDISLAYECRSVVYLEAKEYQLCLSNIELARKNCDINRLEILQTLEDKCRKSMEKHPKRVDDDVWNFFKLSYESNKRNPFIVDCVKLQNNTEYGRFIITTQGYLVVFVM